MNSKDGSIYISVKLNTDDLKRGIREAQGKIGELGKATAKEADAMSRYLKSATTAMAGFFTAQQALQFVNTLKNVRGQFQQLEIAFETMLGSGEKATALMNQLMQTAAKTPFEMGEVAQGAKQLLAYGVASEEVNATLIKLGDIASGLSIPLGDLVYLYGTTLTQGRMYTQDLRQFMGRGIPMAEELAKQLGVTKDKVSELVTEGKIGAEEVKKAIDSLASGKFNNLMEKQAKSLTGQWSNLQDSIQQMLNSIGKSTEGVMGDAIQGLTNLVENYKAVGREIAGLVIAYGTYKAAVITLSAIENLRYQATLAQMAGLSKMAVVTDSLRKKQEALNIVMAKNHYVLAAAGVAALAYGIYKLATAESVAEKATRKVNEEIEALNNKVDENKAKSESLIGTITSETASLYEKNAAYAALKEIMPDVLKGYSMETLAAMKQTDILKLLNAEYEKRHLKAAQALVKEKELALTEARRVQAKSQANTGPITGMGSLYVVANSGVLRAEEELKAAKVAVRKEQEKYYEYSTTSERKVNDLTMQRNANLTRQKKLEKEINDLQQSPDRLTRLTEITQKQGELNALRKQEKEYSEKITEYAKKPAVTDTTGADPAKAPKVTDKERKTRAEYEAERTAAMEEAALKRREAEIKAEGDTLRAKLAAIHLNADKERQALLKEKEKMIKALREVKPGATASDLTAEQKTYLQKMYGLIGDEEKREIQKAQNEVLADYLTFAQKREKLAREWEAKIQDAQNAGATEAQLAEAEKQKSEALKEMDKAFARKEEAFQSWVSSIAEMGLLKLRDALSKAQRELALAKLDGNAEKTALAFEKVQELTGKIKEAETAPSDDDKAKWTDLHQTLTDIGNDFGQIGDIVGGTIGGVIKGLGQAVTQAGKLALSFDQISKAGNPAEKLTAGIGAASAALSVGGMVFDFFKGIADDIDKAETEAYQFRLQAEAINDTLAQTKRAAERARQTLHIFSKDGYAEARDQVADLFFAQEKLNEVLRDYIDYQNTKSFDAVFWQAKPIRETGDALRDVSASLANLQIKTKDKTWIQEFFGAKDEYRSLKDLVPELFGADGLLNMDALGDFVGGDVFEKLGDKAKQTLTKLKEYNEEYKESLQAVQDYLGGVFGSLGNDLMDGVIAAFRAGEDASEAFSASVEQTLEKLVSDMVYSQVFSSILKPAEAELQKLMEAGQGQTAYIDYFDSLLDRLEAGEEMAKGMLKNAQEAGKDRGLDLFAPEVGEAGRRTAEKKGLAQASQDTVDELNGRATAIQEHTYLISENTKLLLTSTQGILNHVAGIHTDTARLQAIEKSARNTELTLQEIKDKGIRLK